MNHANDNHTLTFLSVCSGIEAASVAWHPLGWRAVAYSEIEKFPSAVLAHHYSGVPNLGDFTKIDVTTLGRVDILAGGTPCQAFSVAGLRQSLADARGNLSLEFVRLAHELADSNGLRNAVWENVVGVLSTKDNAFGCFLAGLVGADSELIPCERPEDGKSNRYWKWSKKEKRHIVSWPTNGMVAGPKGRAAWAVKDGQFFRVAQRRRRVLLVADFGAGADPSAVLFEPESLPRDTPPSRETGKDVAGATAGGAGSGSVGLTPSGDIAPCLRARSNSSHRLDTEAVVGYAPEIARCVATREGSSQDYESTTMVAVGVHGDVAHTLKAEGADASEDGTGRGTPVIAFDCKASGMSGFGVGEIASTMRAMGHSDSHSNGGGHQAAAIGSAVRRLTPMECERLQGFPDDYTRIPTRRYKAKKVTRTRPEDMWEHIDGEWWLMSADGPRYKALGNSWAVPKFAWLGKRIQALMPAVAANDNDNPEATIANAA